MNFLTVYLEQFLQGTWAQNVGWTLLHSLWQITLIAALYAVAAVGLRKRSASLRYLVGCVAMAAMVIMPVATFYVLPSPVESVAVEIVESTTVQSSDPIEPLLIADQQEQFESALPVTQPVFDSGFGSQPSNVVFVVEQPSFLERVTLFVQPWLPTATVAWLLGVLLLSLRPLLGCLRVQTLRKSGLTPLAESHCQLAKQLVKRLGIRHVVQFAQSALVEVPTVIGYLEPMVLLPASSVTGLTAAELELILAHELAHIRRHDYALNLIQTVIEALLFYHPGMWWVSSHVRHERENCCDDVAVDISGDRATYIRALAQLEEHRVAPPALGASGGTLLMRVRRLLDQPQAEFGYRKSSIWLTALILGVSLTVAAFAGSLSGGDSGTSDAVLAKLTPAQADEIAKWAKQVVAGELPQEHFGSRLEEIGPESVRALIPLMQRGDTDKVAMDAFTQFLDQPKVQLYLESVLDELPADPSKPANVSHCCLFLLEKYAKNSQTVGSEASHVGLCVKFLKVNPIIALYTLGTIGDRNACDELMAAFQKLPTERWWLIAKGLERVGDPVAIPELRLRLREVELPPNDRFPNITVRTFTDAIYLLSGGADTNHNFHQGVRFDYPYDGPGLPKSYTVSPVSDHYIRLPKVDPSTDEGRGKIWKAIGEQTPGPGLTIDGDEIVLLHGLRAIPVNTDGKPAVKNTDKWICETPAEEFVARFAQPGTTDRVAVPMDGWLLAMDPEQTVHLLRLKKTTEDFQYKVSFSRRLPLISPSVSDEDAGELNFDKQVGQKVAQAIRQTNLPFVDETRLAKIEADFAQFMSSKISGGTDELDKSISADQREAILSAIEKYGAQHLAIDRYRPGDLRSINLIYLGLPDRLLTLKWKLSQAIVHARTLDAGKQTKLAAQRSWMKQHIRALPQYRTFTHEMALVGLEERLRDPLCVTLGDPMTDEQFVLFQQQLQKYISQKSELGHVVSHIVQQSLNAKYRDFGDFDLPFNDRVVSYGAGRVVHLGFQSNRSQTSSLKSIQNIESSGTVIDATTGYLVTAPKESRDPGDFHRWLNEQGKGDFGFDDARDGGLFAVRGAKLVKLDVETWVEADAIGNNELRALLDGPSAGRTISLQMHHQDYLQDNGAPYCYVGVLTKEGRIAVVAVGGFSGRSSIGVRTRVRSTLPEMVEETLSDSEVTLFFDRPAHWVVDKVVVKGAGPTSKYRQPESEFKGTIATIKAEIQDHGVPYSVDVTTKQNPAATVNKVLTVDGEPARLISFRLPGVAGQSTSSGELMRLLFGKGTREYDLTFVYPTNQRKQYVELALVVSKSIRIELKTADLLAETTPSDTTNDEPGRRVRVKGEHAQSGKISVTVHGEFGPYMLVLDHGPEFNSIGGLLSLNSGEVFEYANAPVGSYKLMAAPVEGSEDLQGVLETTFEVKNGETTVVELGAKSVKSQDSATTLLPDVDRRDINTVLDLDSGEFVQNFGRSGDFSKFAEIGKGDLWQDGPNAIGTVRGGKIVFADGREPVRAEQQARAYALPNLPCQFVVITAEGRSFDVKVIAEESGGLKIEYAEKAVPRVSIDPWEDMEESLLIRATKQLGAERFESIAKEANDRDLTIARSYDSEKNGGTRIPGAQAITEAFYLRYLPRARSSAERCAIYMQLAVLHSTNFHPDQGEKPDYAKAREYCRKALEEEPKRIGRTTIRARLNALGPDLSKEEMFSKRLAAYQWLTSWNEQNIRENWLPDRYQIGREDHYFNSFLNFWKSVTESETTNLLGLAYDNPAKLKQIIETAPETEAARRATKQLVALQAADELESQVGDPFVGLYRGTLGERDVTWRILKQNGSYYFKENPDSKTTSEHRKFKLVDGSLVGEDPAEPFRFTTDQASGGLIFEMWNKKSGESYGRIALKRIDESTFTTSGRESNEGTPKIIERTWGPETPDGFQLGIEFTNVPPKRTWHAGSTLNYKLWIRNTSDIPQLATDSFPLRGYYPEILNEQGEGTNTPMRDSGGLTRIRERLLAPGEILEIGTISEQLSSDLKPGRYTCKQIYGITSDSKDNLHMSVSAEFNVAQNEKTAQRETDAPKSTETLNLIAANKRLRWDRLKPNNDHARVLREWDSTPYEEARSIGINKSSELPELWEAVPPGSGSYEIRKDVHGVMATWDTTVYQRPDLNRFWVQRDPAGSSSMTYFGPFEGDPFEVLGIQAKKPKDHRVEKPATKDNVIWGPINEGLQIGVELPDARTMANWRPGSKVAYKLWIKASGRPKPVTDAIPVRGWYPEFRDKDGKRVFQWMPPNDGPVQIRERTLTADGGPVEVGRIEFELPKDIKPGRYSLKQPYRVTSSSQDLLPMEVAFEIEVGAPADHTFHVGGEPKQAGVIRGKVVGDSGPYLVTIEHDVWRNNTGLLPNLVVKSGETFEFMNVPIGRYEIVAKATLVINEGKHQVQTLSQEIAVDDVEPVEVLLVDSRTARVQFRMEMPRNATPLPDKADRVTLTDNDGQKETLTLYKQIYLDEDDVQIAWMKIEGMQPRLDLTFTDESAPKLKAITTPAIKDGRRLVVLLDEEVIAAVTIKSPLDKTISLTGLTYERAKQLHEKVQTTLTRTLTSNSDEDELHRTAIEEAKRGANDLQDAQGKAAFAEYSRVSKAFSEGADHLESGIQFGQIVKQTPANWHSRRRVHELAELLVEMSQQQEPGIKDDESLDARIDRLVWRLRDLAEPAMMIPGKVRVLAFNKDEKKNPAYALLLLAKKPKNKNHAVGRLIAMLDDHRPTRSWATPLNGGHFYRNADVALEILDHVAFKGRRALEDLNFYSGSGRDAYFTTADEKTRREVVTRVKGWWKEQLGVQTGETPTEAQASPSTTSKLIISKERGGQISPDGIGYRLDGELITLDQLQARLKEKLKESPELKLLISADPELPYQTVAVVIQLAKAAGVKKMSIAAAGEKSPPLTPGASSIKLHQDGTVSCIIEVSAGKPLQVFFDRRDITAIEKSSWKVAGNMTQGRLFAGADHPDKPAARLVKLHSEEEKQILRSLNQWFDSLNDEQKREKKLQNLLREVQQFERVFVNSGGVDVQLQKKFQPQANPDPIPPLLISAVNRGELESLTLGRTDQAFELEVDGEWFHQLDLSVKSSPLPPGRMYDPFPLVLDERWKHKQSLKPLQLKPGMHAVRVRRVMHPFPSDAKSMTAISDKIQIQVLKARRKINEQKSRLSSNETVKPSSQIEVIDVVTFKDSGTTSFKLQRPADKAVQIGFDYRNILPEEAAVFKFVGNKTLGRIYVGAEQPDHASARFIQPGGEEDTRLVKELNDWLDQELSADIQTQMLTTPRNSRFYKRLISSTGKTADELKQRESILRRVRWYEHVYLQSQGVHLLLSGDTEKQWNPKEPPTFQITATNYRFPNAPIGDNRTELELGRTHQAFELEVDGQWYRMGIVRFRASPFSPGQIFEDIALPLDGRWLRDGRKFKLSPGKHTFRVRTTFDRLKGVQADEPFTATSNAITCWVAPKEDAEDSESTTQTQAPQKQALLDLEKACRTHLRTMPQSYRISAEARSIDHTRLQLIDSQILTDSAIALLAVGGPEQVAPGSSEKSNELLWCCQLKRIANQDGDARWEVMDTQTVASAIAYRKLESHFYRDHPTFPPGSAKSRKAVVVGAPDGSGLAEVTVKAFVSQQKEPVLDTQTDAEGYFLLPNSPPSEELTGGLSSTRRGYRLQISKPGYLLVRHTRSRRQLRATGISDAQVDNGCWQATWG